jgi:hypothetical protein
VYDPQAKFQTIGFFKLGSSPPYYPLRKLLNGLNPAKAHKICTRRTSLIEEIVTSASLLGYIASLIFRLHPSSARLVTRPLSNPKSKVRNGVWIDVNVIAPRCEAGSILHHHALAANRAEAVYPDIVSAATLDAEDLALAVLGTAR